MAEKMFTEAEVNALDLRRQKQIENQVEVINRLKAELEGANERIQVLENER